MKNYKFAVCSILFFLLSYCAHGQVNNLEVTTTVFSNRIEFSIENKGLSNSNISYDVIQDDILTIAQSEANIIVGETKSIVIYVDSTVNHSYRMNVSTIP